MARKTLSADGDESKGQLEGKEGTPIGETVTNGAEPDIIRPYSATVTIEGVAPILFHRWNNEAVAEKAAAAKGSKAKKSDNVDSYVWRTPEGEIGIPGEYLKGSICDPRNGAAKYRQDPRSPRKSALDLYRAGVIVLTPIASLGKATWDYLDERRVMVQRNGITRVRPAFLAGWRATFEVEVVTPEYIPAPALLAVLTDAGRLVGVGDYRPTYGRFGVTQFEVHSECDRIIAEEAVRT